MKLNFNISFLIKIIYAVVLSPTLAIVHYFKYVFNLNQHHLPIKIINESYCPAEKQREVIL